MRKYEEGYELAEDEFLLKIQKDAWEDGTDKGFLTKFNKNGTMPVAFKEWPHRYYRETYEDIPILVHKEEFLSGWKVMSWRFGQSQNWASLVHPAGFTVEIYLTQLLEIMKSHALVKGELQGEFKWQDHKLIFKAHLV